MIRKRKSRFFPLLSATLFIFNDKHFSFGFFAPCAPVFCISVSDLMPTTVSAGPETREFLLKVIDVLLDFVKATNDRNEKVLDFHHPEDMKRLLDLDVPDRALPLQQLIEDCATTLKYQVKTGEFFGNING